MGESYRIRTNIGQDKEVRVNLEQDYEFLEILSFKIRQRDLYLRNCSDYGVIVGRVFANGGFGIPNAKINVFIPLTDEDAQNPIISTLYPYRNLDTLNEDGYRYNLLPYVPSYPFHAATGTFPDRKDIVNNDVVADIYEKYYKFTVKTNASGDFMIFGVPVGMRTLFMDLDLSDMGDFSLTPQDLIRMGRGTKSQFDGFKFKKSNNLNSLPQIISLVHDVYVAPLWGQEDICQIGITRSDFDLTGEGNIEIKPTAVFMGSIFSSIHKHRVKRNCKVKKDSYDLGSLIAGPGEIVAIRQTIFYDNNDRPILEQAPLPENGRVIDDSGSWMMDIPMNMDYITTNEFGEQVISDDPKVGIPTTAKYRFKIKWQQSKNIYEEFRRAYYLVPNIREYGGSFQDLQNSYAFDLDWSGYTMTSDPNAVNDFIECRDKFYKFEYNKLYTVSSFIDQYKARRSANNFLGVKEITDPKSDSENVKFPVTDAVLKRNFLIILLNILLLISLPIFLALLIIVNILGLIWPILKFIINVVIAVLWAIIWAICLVVWAIIEVIETLCNVACSNCCGSIGNLDCDFSPPFLEGNPFQDIRVPMLSYPDCDFCDEGTESEGSSEPQSTANVTQGGGGTGSGPVANNNVQSAPTGGFPDEYKFQAETDRNQYDDQVLTNQILNAFECDSMVGLRLYNVDEFGNANVNNGDCFPIITGCDYVKDGAYRFCRIPVLGLIDDAIILAEWIARLRFTWALCQGVLNESFYNNWINGTLFMYPFQQYLLYDRKNKVKSSRHCDKVVLFHEKTNTFYYRSTRYDPNSQSFIHRNLWNFAGTNLGQIMNPTTIMNLGPKTPLLQYTSTNGNFLGYVADLLPPTSFGDTSEIVSLFGISRLLNDNLLEQLFAVGGGSIRELFSRGGSKVDGDYAQLTQINSQFGIEKFDEDSYTITHVGNTGLNPVRIFSPKGDNPLIGIFFSATTDMLDQVDYISPGRINIRSVDPAVCPSRSVLYGIESQVVPFYKWNIDYGGKNLIFGSEKNSWVTTNPSFSYPYQRLDRKEKYYYKAELANGNDDRQDRNYIWNAFPDLAPKLNPANPISQFITSAPNYFYFGVKAGSTAIDKYAKDYLVIDINE